MNENYRIVVDAGHGGIDPGAVSGNLLEKDLNLEAANYMYNRFKELGIPVVITRDVDKDLTKYVQNIYAKNCKTQMKQRRSNKNKALFHNLSIKRNICNPLLLTFCCVIFPVFLCIYLV